MSGTYGIEATFLVERPGTREVARNDVIGHAVTQEHFGGDNGCDVSAHEFPSWPRRRPPASFFHAFDFR